MSRSNRGFTLIELMIVVVIVGILAAIAIPNVISLQDRAKDAKVKGAMHTVQLAAEDWAVRNDSIYSDRQEDLQPLMPGGQLLENAFTGQCTEPHFGQPADEPGEVGIVATMLDGVAVGYTITGCGKNGMILTLVSSE